MRTIKLYLGYLMRVKGNGWYALRHEHWLGRPRKFTHLGEALEYLGYKASPPRVQVKGG